jgi:HSP20 family protein
MLIDRVDPFLAEFDRLATRAFGATEGASMPMDIVRRGDALVVMVDLPGAARDAIDITLENRTLTITAKRPVRFGDGVQVIAQERFDGTMSRRLRVPEWVDVEAVTADYTDGVLVLTLPISEQERPRRVEVRAASSPTTATSLES